MRLRLGRREKVGLTSDLISGGLLVMGRESASPQQESFQDRMPVNVRGSIRALRR